MPNEINNDLRNAIKSKEEYEEEILNLKNYISNTMTKEAEAKEAEERIKLMLDCNPLICILRDDSGNIIDCNQEALIIFGVPDKAVFCKNFYSYFPEFQPDGKRSVDKTAEIIRVLDEKGHIYLERTFETPGGELIPVESKIVRIPWKDTYRYLSFSRDLRETKANEKKMQEITERERNAEVQKKAAQAASEAKSQFLANMSHEIRTPMNAILGISELLLQEKLSSRQLQYVGDIKTSTEALLKIINDILDISKLQAGKLNLMPVHYDFNIMLDNVCSIVQFLIKDMDIAFQLIMRERGNICLYGDDLRLRQVLINILSNAIKFTEVGYVRLEVSLTDTSLRITVSDTGIGIPAESIPTLFYPSEQVNLEKNKYKSGSGLGLIIVKSIVEMMNGHITVESTLGQGSSFHIEIPKILGDEKLIHRIESKDISINAPEAKILVVDDSIINLNVMIGLLELCQIKAEKATSGKQAIELVQRNQYDIVFMDYMMPEMNGIETTKIVRESGIAVPIIAITANAIVGAKEMMLEAGMDDYLSKPVSLVELKSMLKKWIPDEKILSTIPKTIVDNKPEDEKYKEFWRKIEQIKEISLSAALKRTDGRWDMYRTMLKLMIQEIEKCNENLNEFLSANDMNSFRIEVHGMKGSLASIAAMELSEKAFILETASKNLDKDFCVSNLPIFLEELNNLKLNLEEAFSQIVKSGDISEIPPELPPVLSKLINAFDEIDLMLIDEEIRKLDTISLNRVLEEEIEQIKEAVLMMDYDKATIQINKLLGVK